MRLLSLTQPWASLVAVGAKQFETRSWPTKYRGWVAIHAAKGYPTAARQFRLDPRVVKHLPITGDNTPLGAVVGVASLTDCLTTLEALCLDEMTDDEKAFGDYLDGRYAFRFRYAQRLTTPVPVRGSLGLQPIAADALKAITDQLPDWAQKPALPEGPRPIGILNYSKAAR